MFGKVIAMFREFGNPCVFCMCLLVMVGVTFWVIFGLGLVTVRSAPSPSFSPPTPHRKNSRLLVSRESAPAGRFRRGSVSSAVPG